MEVGSLVLTDLVSFTKAVENVRTEIVKPHNDFVKEVNAFFKDNVSPAAEAEAVLRRKIGGFVREQQEEARAQKAKEDAELAARQKAAAKKGEVIEDFEAPVSFVPEVKKSAGRVSTQQRWSYSVEDVSKLPSDYQVVSADLGKIRAAVEAGVREIAGVKIYQETITVVR